MMEVMVILHATVHSIHSTSSINASIKSALWGMMGSTTDAGPAWGVQPGHRSDTLPGPGPADLGMCGMLSRICVCTSHVVGCVRVFYLPTSSSQQSKHVYEITTPSPPPSSPLLACDPHLGLLPSPLRRHALSPSLRSVPLSWLVRLDQQQPATNSK